MYMSRRQDVHVSERKKLRWTIASARHNLPTVVGLAAREPQDIYRRDKLVARIVSPDAAAPPAKKPLLAELLAEIQRACAEEAYALAVSPREDRPNPFVRPPRARSPKRRRRRAR